MRRVARILSGIAALTMGTLAFSQEIQPGLYATTLVMEMSGQPPRTIQDKDCVTAKDVADGLTRIGVESDSECKVEGFSKGSGKLSYRLMCLADGNKVTSVVTGTYTPDSYDFVIKSAGKVQVSMRARGKRVGTCK